MMADSAPIHAVTAGVELDFGACPTLLSLMF